MSLIRGVLLAEQFRTHHELNAMSPEDQRNTLIVEMAAHSNQSIGHYQSLNNTDLAGTGAAMAFLRKGRIRNDADLKKMSGDDQRNTLIVEIGTQTGMGGELQGLSNIDLVQMALGKARPGNLSPSNFIRGVLLAGKFRTQHELDKMSDDDQRNTLIVEMAGHSNQSTGYFQSLNDLTLAGVGAVMIFLREARIRDDAELKKMSADDQRNTLIVEIDGQTHLGSRLQGLSNIDLVLAGLGVDVNGKLTKRLKNCDPIREQIKELRGEISGLQADLQDAPPTQKAGIIRQIKAKRAELTGKQAELAACEGPPTPHPLPPRVDPATVPMAVSLIRVKCIEQEDSELPFIDNEDDEPYVIVLAIYGQGRFLGIPGNDIQLAQSRLFRIGPMEGFDQGDVRTPPDNLLWGLNNTPAPIALINQLVFLVVLFENDNANPAEVENKMVSIGQAGLAGLNIAAAGRPDLDPQARFELFISTAQQSFDGAADLARLDVFDPDDKIGPVQVLRFFDQEQQSVLRRDTPAFERTLRFQGDDADYELTFALRR